MTWGGGGKRVWRGSVVVTNGQISEPRGLSAEADAADTYEVIGDTLQFAQPTAMIRDGLDMRIIGTRESTLRLEFTPLDKTEGVQRLEVPLADFVPAVPFTFEAALDDRDNAVQVQRAPGDRLRVEFERDSLVFDPGEVFHFNVRPHELGLPEGTSLRCGLQLLPTGDDEVLWKETRDLRVDARGGTEPIGPLAVTVPVDEGVYEFVIALNPRRFTDALVPNALLPSSLVPAPLAANKPLMQRKIQFIVLDNQPTVGPVTEWKMVEEIDPGNPKWWARLKLPQWNRLPGLAPAMPLGDRPLQPRDEVGQRMQEIGPAGWHAAPIPIAELNQPHQIEIDYPTHLRQTLGISIVEPDAAGNVKPLGVDSGIDVSNHFRAATPQVATHRLTFWPRTKTPWLLLTNRRDDGTAVFGKIRVLAGPTQLAPAAAPLVNSRILAAYFEKPLMAENFGADEALDPASNHSLKDWQTFYVGGLRTAEYLKHVGYNAAVIAVATDGGTIYPSRWLDTTPKFDNGRLFLTGQDPVPKDILEMLFRIFDREGLRLIPAMQFGGPLPELERQQRIDDKLGGIKLLGMLPGDSRPTFGTVEASNGLSPQYNPLDPRVQLAMRTVAGEVTQRYAAHQSFAGLAVQLSPQGYAVLPDDAWGLDDATFARFARDIGVSAPLGSDRLEKRMQLVRGDERAGWLRWRAAELTKLYRDFAADLRQSRPDAKLLLTTTELVAGRVLQSALRPRLPARAEFADAMLRHGIDATALARDAQAELLRPHRVGPLSALATQATNLELARSDSVDEYFRRAGLTGVMAINEPQPLRVPSFDQVSPFGAEHTKTVLAAQLIPTGDRGRARFAHALAAFDSTLIVDGGTMLPLGQEIHVNRFSRLLGQLPAASFLDVPATTGANSTGVVVRQLARADGQFLYVVNPSGLPVQVTLEFTAIPGGVLRSFDHRPLPPMPQPGAIGTWTIQLEAHDATGIVGSPGALVVRDWRVEFGAEGVAELANLVQDLRVRVDRLSKPQPLNTIVNADFEQLAVAGQVPGWSVSPRPGVTISTDNGRPHGGQQSLLFRNQQPKTVAWVRSRPFPIPRTGRIAVQAWIRTRDANQPPPVYLSIEGTLAGNTPYYRPSPPLGREVDRRTLQPTGRRAAPIPADWSRPFLFHVVDLPTSGPGEISVGFDMFGPGDLWIDDVQVFDVYFEDAERNELVKSLAYAGLQLERNEVAECQRLLQGYWPRFVLEYVPLQRVAQASPVPPVNKPAEKSRWNKIAPLKNPFR